MKHLVGKKYRFDLQIFIKRIFKILIEINHLKVFLFSYRNIYK